MWEQGRRSGESTRLPPMWAGFNSRSRRHMWVEFVVGSRPCSEVGISCIIRMYLACKSKHIAKIIWK